MKILISNCIVIQEPTKDIKDFCKKKLTFTNPDYDKKKRMGFWVYGTPKQIKLYNEYNNMLYIPVGFFEELYKFHPISSDYIDYSVSRKINIDSDIVLRDYQEPGLKAIEEHYCGLFVLPCGLSERPS